jgi:hypothetical protein
MMMLVAAKFCIGIFITLALVALGMLVAVLRGRMSTSTSTSTSRSTRPECGRVVCAWCVPMRDLGPAPGLAAGLTTHGICGGCLDGELAKLSPKKT